MSIGLWTFLGVNNKTVRKRKSLQFNKGKLTKEKYWIYKLNNKMVHSSQLKTFTV